MAYRFYPVEAVDPVTGSPLRRQGGRLFAADDANREHPLTVVDTRGRKTQSLAIGDDGLVPGFDCELPFVYWVSDHYELPLNSAHSVDMRYRRRICRRDLIVGSGVAVIAGAAIGFGVSRQRSDGGTPRSAQKTPAQSNHTADLQKLLDAQPQGGTVLLPARADGSPYYVARQLSVPEGVTLQGAAPVRNLNGGWHRGGVVIAPSPGLVFQPGEAVVACSGARSQLVEIAVVAGNQADYAVIDGSRDSVHTHLATYGGRVCSYDASHAKRVRLEVPSITGLPEVGAVSIRFGQDSQMMGGTKNSGTFELVAAHAQVTGAHLTGGAPNVNVKAGGCQLSGCVIDGASGVAMVQVAALGGHLNVTGVQFYQPQSPSNGQVPAVKVAGRSSGVIANCTVEIGSRAPKLPYFIEFGGLSPWGWNVSSVNVGAAAVQLWDRQPGNFSGVLGPDGRYHHSP